MGDLKDAYLKLLVDGVPDALRTFDERTGRFLHESGGWAVTLQDVIYPLAVLYTTEHPNNPCFRDETVLDRALRGGDALRDFQEPDGRVTFIKVDGSTWGKIYMPWTMYHWLEAYAVLRERMDRAREARWREGLLLAYEGIVGELRALTRIHNIPTWKAMAAYRAGQVFGRPEWFEVATEVIRKTAAEQRPGGYWSEHAGPTTSYNFIYLHSLALYHRFSGDGGVLEALRRGLDFHLTFTYPDGSAVETVDERVKYHARAVGSAHVAFSLFPEGRRFVRLLLNQMRAQGHGGGATPHHASHFLHVQEGDEREIPQIMASYGTTFEGTIRVRKEGPWFVCLSGMTADPADGRSRFIMDRHNSVSVWHERTGLIVGGGNSKRQPEASTYSVLRGRSIQHIADEGRVTAEGARETLSLRYGDLDLKVSCEAATGDRTEIVFSGAPDGDAARVQAALTLILHVGEGLTDGTGRAFEVEAGEIALSGEELGGAISHHGWTLSLPPEAVFRWPVSLFNPYLKHGREPLEERKGLLTLPANCRLTLTIA